MNERSLNRYESNWRREVVKVHDGRGPEGEVLQVSSCQVQHYLPPRPPISNNSVFFSEQTCQEMTRCLLRRENLHFKQSSMKSRSLHSKSFSRKRSAAFHQSSFSGSGDLRSSLTKMRSNHSSSFFMKRVRLKYVIEPVENSVRDNFVLLEFYHDTPSFVWILESIIEH